MKWFLHKVERFVDKSIPYLILALIGVVITDVFFTEFAAKYHSTMIWIDSVVIGTFVVDLIFKYNRVRNVPRFLKMFWLDILAVFPFFFVLRFFEEIFLISERSALTLRNLFHAGLVLEEEVLAGSKLTKVAGTAEILAKEGRVALFAKWFAPLRRIPRFFKAISFYEHPKFRKTKYHK